MKATVLALAFAASAGALQAQSRVTITDLGPGSAGRILRDALNRPHRLVEPPPDSAAFVQSRGEREPATLVVLGRTAYIGGKVDGDVIVVNGDLFVRAGAEITGRAVAIGGGTYPSTLAFIGGGAQSFRDDGYEIARSGDGYHLNYKSLVEYASPPLLFPGIYGLRFPSYDRVNGASIPFGPAFAFWRGRAEANLLATYRSDLGKVDPSIRIDAQLTRRSRVELSAERATLSNDAWIWTNLVNSMSAFVFGEDTRNYYRADRGQLTLHRSWEWTRTVIEPFIGARYEDSRSVGPALGATSGPFSVIGRNDTLGMMRPNPAVTGGPWASALAGTAYRWESDQLRLAARTVAEHGIQTASTGGGVEPSFTQVTTDVEVRFPTFGEQEYAAEVHWVTSSGQAPTQRFVYFGGPGTMPFLELLEQGGDRLLLIDQRYAIPLVNVTVGIMGVPTLQLRHRLGAAGLGRLPSLEQMIGFGVMLTIIRGEVQMDPATGKVRATMGFTFAR